MIKCPRCGFEQPRDRFCAKCGIVMDNFTTKARGYGATPYILSLIIVIISAGLIYRYLYHRPDDQSLTTAVAPETSPTKTRPLSTPVDQVKNLAAITQPKSKTETEDVAPITSPGAGEAPPAVQPTPQSAQEKSEATTVAVDFDLVSKDVMERMSQEGEGHLDIGTYSVSVVPQFKTKYDAVRGDESFHQLGADSKTLTLSQPSMVFRGGKEPKRNEAIGLYVEITPLRSGDRGMEYKISIKRSLPEVVAGNDIKVVSQDYDQTVVIPKGSGAVVAGLLPRKPLLEGEDKLYETNILKAVLDPAFQKGESEFLVVVAPQ